MRCGRCRLQFCWACMRPMRKCTHFKCANGAPEGDSTLWEQFAADGDRWALAGEQTANLARIVARVADGVAAAMAVLMAVSLVVDVSGTPAHVAQRIEAVLAWPMLLPAALGWACHAALWLARQILVLALVIQVCLSARTIVFGHGGHGGERGAANGAAAVAGRDDAFNGPVGMWAAYLEGFAAELLRQRPAGQL
mmetsp:Transcript_28121/g.71927  ORF Transcript_28121/g.71927 Transcript_28121/m.71927 type:complete len:195 (+) Transcript_28121:1130-1714(+)